MQELGCQRSDKAMMWKVRTLKRRVNHLLTGAPLGEGPGPEDWGNGTNV